MSPRFAQLRRVGIIAIAALLIAPLLTVVDPFVDEAHAANGADFNPGYIISDAQFFDGGSMSPTSVQAFIQGQVGSCASGATCLLNYTQPTPSIAADAYCAAYPGSGNERAADIIAKVGAACGISPKVLLVLLQKEMSLVTLRSPDAWRFTSATGFSCPDTAPCDPAFSGFFYQVYYAARQFQRYVKHPTWWNYQPGRVNQILYNPNSGCGSSPVYIQNAATAALYIYTPYQPNAAALSNLYGTGDGCSSYGNRNFWRLFSDWFGSPTEASSLVRTEANATVYLVSGTMKYPVPSIAILTAYAPLGQVGFVSQSYLDRLTTGHNVGRTIRDAGGTIYFTDAGIKLPLTSCAQAVDYGASCASNGYVQLTDAQAAAFVNGPALSNLLGTTSGSRYWIKDGVKREILDVQSQSEAGVGGALNVLSENAVSTLPFGDPIVRDSVFVGVRGSGAASLLVAGTAHSMNDADAVAYGATSRLAGSLWAGSLARIPSASVPFSGVVTDAAAPGTAVVLSSAGRLTITGGGYSVAAAPVPVAAALIASYVSGVAIAPGSFIKGPDRADVFVVMPTDLRAIAGWNALLALSPTGDVVITTVPRAMIDRFTLGTVALTSGTLVRSPGDATVYLVNGVTNKIPLSSFEFTEAAGFNQLSFHNQDHIDAYPTSPVLAGFGWVCDGVKYLGAGSALNPVSAETAANYPFGWVELDPFVCAKAKFGAEASTFIRTADGSIYQVVAGVKRPIASMAVFVALAAGKPWLTVSSAFAGSIPTGPLATP